jgi:hypothetical protein
VLSNKAYTRMIYIMIHCVLAVKEICKFLGLKEEVRKACEDRSDSDSSPGSARVAGRRATFL